MKTVRPSSADALGRHLAVAQVAQPTYEPVGATLSGELPGGFHHLRLGLDLGRGPAVFDRAVLGIKTWKAHAVPFLGVHPDGVPVQVGETVLVTIGLAALAAVVPCRIVAVVDDPDRFGFAYGTLPGHLERGEEAFLVTRGSGDVVRVEIRAFSQPADTVMRVVGPLGHMGQRIVGRGYLRALKKFVQAA